MRVMMYAKYVVLICLGVIGCLFAGIASLQAQTDITDNQVNEVAKDMFCPTCENTPLDVCPTQTCADWRELIREQLAQGMTKEEIYLYFANTYGDHVLSEPPQRGFDVIVWLMPLLAVVIGGALLYQYLNNIRTKETMPATPSPAPSTPANKYVTRIEEELKVKK